jgi:3-oxoacyl-[acyl-carrier protein] reductase
MCNTLIIFEKKISMLLKDKVVIITGASRGIGKSIAQMCVNHGAKVAFTYLSSDEKARALEAELTAQGGVAVGFKSDASNFDQAHELVDQVIEQFGTVDVLVNNAGITRDAMFAKMTEEQWSKVIDVNLNGVFNATKAVVDIMIKQKYGKIISTSSVVAHYGNIGQANYAATKGALISFTQTLAKELGKHNINVNAVSPGFIATDIVKTIPDNIIQAFTERSSLKRMGDPNDIANVYKFLASEDASYITGTVIQVDGGLSI